MRQKCTISLEGIVQGVGFRPFVHGLASALGLAGRVRNDACGLAIELEGERAEIDDFLEQLAHRAPPLARLGAMRIAFGDALGAAGFRIDESCAAGMRSIQIAADAATCDACLGELFDPADRRYRYPFINCSHCGPRFTIVRELPYDRARTTMAGFAMCTACRAEYEDPADRRFHAQPIACPACGPRLVLRDSRWREIAAEPIAAAAEALAAGSILALKGLGGYHLACDAASEAAVRTLRSRKRREAKPLALMVADLDAAQALCRMSEAEKALLASPRRPIVLLARRSGGDLAHAVAPGNRDLGVMLPCTPLHHLLLRACRGALVMTSANLSEEPLVHQDDEARARLAGVAERFLTHERPIEARCDDSVTRIVAGEALPIRRARGFAPQPVTLPLAARAPLLALGGDLKACFALVRGRQAFLGPHIGDLADFATWRDFGKALAHYQRLLDIRPALVAHDLHPAYLSSRFAAELEGVARIEVQHHHAHIAACMAENGVAGPVIGVAFDGTGYGCDGASWGGEFLVADLHGFERVAHLAYVPAAGGDAAVRQPWRSAAAQLHAAGLECEELAERIGEARWNLHTQLLAGKGRCVPSSSVGRLCDAVAALLGLCDEARFEAQAAMALESVADENESATYPVVLGEQDGLRVWHAAPVIAAVLADRRKRRPAATIAGRFHNTMAAAVLELCRAIRRERGLARVALSGGVFQNRLFTERSLQLLGAAGFEVLRHREVPPNDGGLCLGQAAIACAKEA